MNFFYRGVNVELDKYNQGKIYPAGASMEVSIRLDGKFSLDETWFIGECEENAARAQQKDNGLYDSAGVSTTRSIDVAIKFATSGNMEAGYVYVLDETRLAALGIVMKEFSNAENPHEQEVTLLIPDMQPVPAEAIIDKIEFAADGSPARPTL